MIEFQLLPRTSDGTEEPQLWFRVRLRGEFTGELDLQLETAEVLSFVEQLAGFPRSTEQVESARLVDRHAARFADFEVSCIDRSGHVRVAASLGSGSGQFGAPVWDTVTANVAAVAAEIDVFQKQLVAIIKGIESHARLA